MMCKNEPIGGWHNPEWVGPPDKKLTRREEKELRDEFVETKRALKRLLNIFYEQQGENNGDTSTS